MISRQGRIRFRDPNRARWCLLALLLGLAPAARADSLDFVLDVLYKAGVVDGNVRTAKPLIACLANGGSVQSCTLGNAGQTELAGDPQVRNAIEVYHAYQDKDWPGLVDKAGVTVGCALIPGGQAKDLLCGEIGKLALAVAEGVASVLSDAGEAVADFLGLGEDDEPAPMPAEDYFRLYEMPAYHRMVMSLDAADGSAEQLAQALYQNCRNYYGGYDHYAGNDCEVNKSLFLQRTADLHKRLLAEGASWLQMHAEPKLHDWARQNFGGDVSSFVFGEVWQCRADLQAAIPMPEPGFQRCDMLKARLESLPMVTSNVVAKFDGMCRVEANSMVVIPPNDAYKLACEGVSRKLPARIVGQMGVWKQRMNLAQSAGCANEGNPNSVHCDTYASQAACMKSVPEAASICRMDRAKADLDFAQQLFAELYRQSASAGKPQRCLRADAQVLCFRPVKFQGCRTFVLLKGDQLGLTPRAGEFCKLLADPQYEELKARALQIVGRLNGQVAATLAPRPRLASNATASLPAPHGLSSGGIAPSAALALEDACHVSLEDPLRIHCKTGFQWDADPDRARAVRQLNDGQFALCGPDLETDGADLPCLDGVAVGAFPSGPAAPPTRPRLTLPRITNGG